MDRLFVPIYARLLAAMVAAVLAIYVLLVPRVQARVNQNFADVLSPILSMHVHQLDLDLRASPERAPALISTAAAERFEAPCSFVDRGSLQLAESELAELDAGKIVARGNVPDIVLFARVGMTEHVLRWGPLEPEHPIGEERGVLLAALVLLGLFLGAYLLLLPIQRRLKALGAVAEELGRGRLDARAKDEERDAIGRLGATFNRMAEQLKRLISAQEELLRTVSHELRTPLQRAHLALELVESAADQPGQLAAAARMERSLDEIDALIEELLIYSRLNGVGPSPALTEVTVVVEELCGPLREDFAGTVLEVKAPGAIEVELDERLFGRAVSNLIINALKHARSRVQVELTRRDRGLVVVVEDDGPGVPPDERELIFEPFRTIARGEKSASGHGLGLAIVRRIAELHGGSVAVGSAELGGARFQLDLPG